MKDTCGSSADLAASRLVAALAEKGWIGGLNQTPGDEATGVPKCNDEALTKRERGETVASDKLIACILAGYLDAEFLH